MAGISFIYSPELAYAHGILSRAEALAVECADGNPGVSFADRFSKLQEKYVKFTIPEDTILFRSREQIYVILSRIQTQISKIFLIMNRSEFLGPRVSNVPQLAVVPKVSSTNSITVWRKNPFEDYGQSEHFEHLLERAQHLAAECSNGKLSSDFGVRFQKLYSDYRDFPTDIHFPYSSRGFSTEVSSIQTLVSYISLVSRGSQFIGSPVLDEPLPSSGLPGPPTLENSSTLVAHRQLAENPTSFSTPVRCLARDIGSYQLFFQYTLFPFLTGEDLLQLQAVVPVPIVFSQASKINRMQTSITSLRQAFEKLPYRDASGDPYQPYWQPIKDLWNKAVGKQEMIALMWKETMKMMASPPSEEVYHVVIGERDLQQQINELLALIEEKTKDACSWWEDCSWWEPLRKGFSSISYHPLCLSSLQERVRCYVEGSETINHANDSNLWVVHDVLANDMKYLRDYADSLFAKKRMEMLQASFDKPAAKLKDWQEKINQTNEIYLMLSEIEHIGRFSKQPVSFLSDLPFDQRGYFFCLVIHNQLSLAYSGKQSRRGWQWWETCPSVHFQRNMNARVHRKDLAASREPLENDLSASPDSWAGKSSSSARPSIPSSSSARAKDCSMFGMLYASISNRWNKLSADDKIHTPPPPERLTIEMRSIQDLAIEELKYSNGVLYEQLSESDRTGRSGKLMLDVERLAKGGNFLEAKKRLHMIKKAHDTDVFYNMALQYLAIIALGEQNFVLAYEMLAMKLEQSE